MMHRRPRTARSVTRSVLVVIATLGVLGVVVSAGGSVPAPRAAHGPSARPVLGLLLPTPVPLATNKAIRRLTAPAGAPIRLPSQWPGLSNTGVPAGTALSPRSGQVVLNRNGQVLSGVVLTGCISVTARNVTIKNSRVLVSGCYAGIRTDGGANLVIEDTEVNGLGVNGDSFGVAGHNGSYSCLRCNVHGVGVAFSAGDTGSALIQDSWGWGLVASASSHNQTFLSNGSTKGVTLRHNRLENPLGQTAVISLFGDFAPIQNVTVDDNLLGGGDFCVYGGHDTDKPFGTQDQNVRFTNNRFLRTPEPGAFYPRCAVFGPVTGFDAAGPGNVWSGNVWDDTGAPLPA